MNNVINLIIDSTKFNVSPVNTNVNAPITPINVVPSQSINFYKGTSFRWCGSWLEGRSYTNDEFFIDVVYHKGKSWTCVENHISSASNEPSDTSTFWQISVQQSSSGVHVGPEAPTEEEYGDLATKMLWLDTDEGNDSLKVYSTDQTYNRSEVDDRIEAAKNTTKTYTEGAVEKSSKNITDAYKSADTTVLESAKANAAGLNAAMDKRVSKLESIDHKKLAADASADAVATILDGAPESFDTLKEVAQWISNSEAAAEAADLITKVSNLESGKVDKIEGKKLSTNDFTDEYKERVDRLSEYAAETVFPVTYSELKELRNAGKLVRGAFYRITDYVTTTSQSYTESAGHPFDIIVLALDKHTLSEEAYATHREGDTYFSKSNLGAWKLWYSFDNNKSKYAWAKADARPHTWTCSGGVLGTSNSLNGTLDYETVNVDGTTYYLYTPENPKQYSWYSFMRKANILVDSIEDFTYVLADTSNGGHDSDCQDCDWHDSDCVAYDSDCDCDCDWHDSDRDSWDSDDAYDSDCYYDNGGVYDSDCDSWDSDCDFWTGDCWNDSDSGSDCDYDSGDGGYDSDCWDCDEDVKSSRIDVYYRNTKIATFGRYGDVWYDINDSNKSYMVRFSDNCKPISGITKWWNEFMGGSVTISSGYESFEGDFSKIKLAFTSPLTYNSRSDVYWIYSEETNDVYFYGWNSDCWDCWDSDCWDSDSYDSWDSYEDHPLASFDYVIYNSFIPYEDSGRGVIYRMIDEFGNDVPWDFKNLKVGTSGGSTKYYVFGDYRYDIENTVYGVSCKNNVIQISYSSTHKLIPICFEKIMSNNTFVISEDTDYVYFAAPVYESNFKIRNGWVIIQSTSAGVYQTNFVLLNTCYIGCGLQTCNIKMSNASLYARSLLYSNVCLQGRYGESNFSFIKKNSSTPETFHHANLDITSNIIGDFKFLTNPKTSGTGISGQTAIDIKLSNIAAGEIDISTIPMGATYWTHVGQNSSGVIKIWNPADLIQ